MIKDDIVNRVLEGKCPICNEPIKEDEEVQEEIYLGMVVKVHKRHMQ